MPVPEKPSSCWDSCLSCLWRSRPAEEKDNTPVVIAKEPDRPQPPTRDSTLPRTSPRTGYYVALYDYSARTDQDLSFRSGNTLEVLDQSSAEWWFARALTGISASREGYIPANYVAPVESIHAQPWHFPETKRQDAEKMLQAEGNKHGAFLIRNRGSQRGELALSVLDNRVVRHFKVKKQDDGHFFVSKDRSFPTLSDLVEHYSKQPDGLCVRLREPCEKPVQLEAPQTYGLSYNTEDNWEIERSSVQLLRWLGAGQFGVVYEGLWNNTTPVAVKTLKPGAMDSKDFLQEAQMMKKLRHPKLIQLYAVCTRGDPVYIITELMRHGSLLEHLQKDKGATLQILDQIEMAAQVASGMAYLEQKNYIHRDLAARNVLVGESDVCKVADFGLARVFMREGENVYEAREGTKFPVKWTAPEAIHENKFTTKSDVWSFGVLLYEVMTFGQMPYPTMSNKQVTEVIVRGYRMPRPARCPKFLYDIMTDCWKPSELERPTFETLRWKLEDYFDMDVNSYDDADNY